jgi:hypothetical protein
MSDRVRLTGVFAAEEACARAIEQLRERPGELQAFSPFASERILEALRVRPSPARRWVLAGGITGCASGFALTIGLSAEYPHVTAGMPIVSIPPFVIIAFELTILFGALAGVLGFLVHGRFPQLAPVAGYDERFSADRFGLSLECAATERAALTRLLYDAGAVEVIDAAG